MNRPSVLLMSWMLALLTVAASLGLSSTGPCQAAPPNASQGLRDVTIRLNWYPDGEYSYLYYGIEKGIFAKAGFRVTLAPGSGSSVSARLIGGGHEDAGLVSAEYVLMGLAKGLQMKTILVMYHRNPVVIYSLAEKNIRRLTDLYGKRVGVMLDSNTYPQYEGVCRLARLDRSRIREIPINGQTALRAVVDDRIDAHVWHVLNGSLPLRMRGYKVNEIPLEDHGIKMYGMCFVVGPKLMGDPDAVRRLRGAVQKSLELARANPQAALGATERALGLKDSRIDRAKFDTFLSLVFDSQTPKLGIGYQTASGWQSTARTLHTMGQLDDVNIYRQASWTD